MVDPSGVVRDLIAGVTLALTSIPQAVAYAELSGVAGWRGLATMGFPCMAYALVTGSPWASIGVTSITALMAKTASPRDVVALARLMEKMVSSGGAVMILDDILELPNGPEAEKVASLPADRPRNHWVTPTLAVMPLSRSRFQRSIVVDYSSVLVKGF